jgi:hypothetical protein
VKELVDEGSNGVFAVLPPRPFELVDADSHNAAAGHREGDHAPISPSNTTNRNSHPAAARRPTTGHLQADGPKVAAGDVYLNGRRLTFT